MPPVRTALNDSYCTTLLTKSMVYWCQKKHWEHIPALSVKQNFWWSRYSALWGDILCPWTWSRKNPKIARSWTVYCIETKTWLQDLTPELDTIFQYPPMSSLESRSSRHKSLTTFQHDVTPTTAIYITMHTFHAGTRSNPRVSKPNVHRWS